MAETERPGAVHLEFPEDIAEEQTDLTPIAWQKIRRPVADDKSMARAVEAIKTAKTPLVLIAAAANRKLVRKQLRNFVDKTGVPFVTTQMGKGVEDESLPGYLGTTALSSDDFVHRMLEKADVILVVGHDISEKPPVIPQDGHTLIHINFYPADIDDVYTPAIEVVGDISHSLWSFAEQIEKQDHWDFAKLFELKDKLKQDIEQRTTDPGFPIKPQRLVKELREVMPKDGILSLDNGMYKLWIARNYPAFEQNTVLLDNALATMGAGLASGMAAKILNPDKKVVVVAGDGGFVMNMADLETAKRLNLDLVVLILNDNGYGMIKWKQESMGLTDFGLSFSNPDFIKLAESFGVKGYRITSSDQFKPTLQSVIDSTGIHIIDVPIDYSENASAFGVALKDKTLNL
jgi:acetolactate synthase-1/2/3 large subunit